MGELHTYQKWPPAAADWLRREYPARARARGELFDAFRATFGPEFKDHMIRAKARRLGLSEPRK